MRGDNKDNAIAITPKLSDKSPDKKEDANKVKYRILNCRGNSFNKKNDIKNKKHIKSPGIP